MRAHNKFQASPGNALCVLIEILKNQENLDSVFDARAGNLVKTTAE